MLGDDHPHLLRLAMPAEHFCFEHPDIRLTRLRQLAQPIAATSGALPPSDTAPDLLTLIRLLEVQSPHHPPPPHRHHLRPGTTTDVLLFTCGTTEQRNTKKVRVCDLRASMPQFGKRSPLTRDWIAQRDDSLDISWVKDDSAEFPEPAALATEALGEPGHITNDLRGILADLGETPEEAAS